MGGVNVHIYQSTCTHESRLLRITQTLRKQQLFDRIYIVGRHEEGLAESEPLDDVRSIWRVRNRIVTSYRSFFKGLAMLEWGIRVVTRLLTLPITCINCHSLVVLPLCVVLKLWHRCRLVYDTHELETETTTSRGIRRSAARLVERSLIGFADQVVAVTESIAKWYEKTYRLTHVTVVKNTPPRPAQDVSPTSYLKLFAGLDRLQQLYIYQGCIGPGRGVELLLRVFAELARSEHHAARHVIFVGFGPLVDEVQAWARLHSTIHYHPPVPPQEIAAVTSGADVGIALLENTSLNHYYCLGNKVFEYLQYGLPILVSDFPEMGALVTRHNCGWKIDVEQPAAVAALIASISWSDIEQAARCARACRGQYVWEHEEPHMLEVYRRLRLAS